MSKVLAMFDRQGFLLEQSCSDELVHLCYSALNLRTTLRYLKPGQLKQVKIFYEGVIFQLKIVNTIGYILTKEM